MVFEKLSKLIAEHFSMDAEEIPMDPSFVEDLNADSIDIMDLMMSVEEEFGLEEADESAMESIKTVGDVVGYISERI